MINLMNGVTKKVRRAGLGMLVLGALAACDPVPTGDTTCKSAFACEVIELTAKNLRDDIGRNFGGGVVLRNTRAIGQTLVLDVSLPFSSAVFKEPEGQRVLQEFGKNLGRGFCRSENADRFFESGSLLRGRGFSKDNKLVVDQVIRSCGRR
jgi:hypothetical protein